MEGKKNDLISAVKNGNHEEVDRLIFEFLEDKKSVLDYEIRNIIAAWNFKNRNTGEAITLYRRSIFEQKKQLTAYVELAAILNAADRWEEATEVIDSGLENNPADVSLLELKVAALHGAKKYGEAEKKLKFLLNKRPDSAKYWTTLGNIYLEMTDIDAAIECHRKAVNLEPGLDAALFNFITTMHYSPRFSNKDINEILKAYSSSLNYESSPIIRLNKCPDDKIRVGLISNGFRNNPVGQMIYPGLSELDSCKFELFFYSSSLQEDFITEKLRKLSSKYQSIVNITDDDLFSTMQADELDVLFELSGYHAGSRMGVIARRPAPVQIKWVGGLINSTQIKTIDYLLSDRVETPEGVDEEYSEKIIRMPTDYICYSLPSYIPDVKSLPALKNNHITFGCLNNASKINSELISIWANILKQVPNSKLLLKSFQFESDFLKLKIRREFSSRGVAEQRIEMEGASPHKEHLDTYNKIDIALDTWPYSGGLTTCEAMAMGVPVITMPGPTFAGRHSATHLAHAGMPELIAKTVPEYIHLAISLSADIESLATIRSHLRRILENSAVCDANSFGANLSKALMLVVDRNRKNLPPESISFV